MSDLQELTTDLMQDEDFRREYEALQPEMDITRALLDARIQAGLTQSQLSERTGISQADISRLEKGTRNPSLSLLKRLAEAMNSTLKPLTTEKIRSFSGVWKKVPPSIF